MKCLKVGARVAKRLVDKRSEVLSLALYFASLVPSIGTIGSTFPNSSLSELPNVGVRES